MRHFPQRTSNQQSRKKDDVRSNEPRSNDSSGKKKSLEREREREREREIPLRCELFSARRFLRTDGDGGSFENRHFLRSDGDGEHLRTDRKGGSLYFRRSDGEEMAFRLRPQIPR